MLEGVWHVLGRKANWCPERSLREQDWYDIHVVGDEEGKKREQLHLSDVGGVRRGDSKRLGRYCCGDHRVKLSLAPSKKSR